MNDADLIRGCARGEEDAFRTLIERVEKPLINFVVRYVGSRATAEDIFQDTMVRVLRNIADFEPKASLRTWIFTIARNLCLDEIKARKRHREVSIDSAQKDRGGKVIDFREALRGRIDGPDRSAEQSEQEERVTRALGSLSPAKREAVVLRVFVGMPYREIAKVVDSPVGTVKFRVHEAVQDLARELGETTGGAAETG